MLARVPSLQLTSPFDQGASSETITSFRLHSVGYDLRACRTTASHRTLHACQVVSARLSDGQAATLLRMRKLYCNNLGALTARRRDLLARLTVWTPLCICPCGADNLS